MIAHSPFPTKTAVSYFLVQVKPISKPIYI